MSLSVTIAIVEDESTELFHCRSEACLLSLHNHSGGNIYIGEEGVTTATGFQIANNREFQITIYNGDKLYGVVNSGTSQMDILHTQPNP